MRVQEGILVTRQLEATGLAALGLEATATRVRRLALHFLARWSDTPTVNLVEDLAQLSTLDTLIRLPHLHNARCLPGFVRTVARRRRYRTLVRERRRREAAALSGEFDIPARRREAVMLRVCSRWIDRDLLLPWLDDALARLTPLNSQLLREFYGGKNCRELAVRHRLSPDTVKVRLHRSRQRVRVTIERRAVSSLV